MVYLERYLCGAVPTKIEISLVHSMIRKTGYLWFTINRNNNNENDWKTMIEK